MAKLFCKGVCMFHLILYSRRDLCFSLSTSWNEVCVLLTCFFGCWLLDTLSLCNNQTERWRTVWCAGKTTQLKEIRG